MGKHHMTVIWSQSMTLVTHFGHVTRSQSQSQHVMRKIHDRNNMRTIGGYCIATVVKCISSVQNQMRTLSSSSCQF